MYIKCKGLYKYILCIIAVVLWWIHQIFLLPWWGCNIYIFIGFNIFSFECGSRQYFEKKSDHKGQMMSLVIILTKNDLFYRNIYLKYHGVGHMQWKVFPDLCGSWICCQASIVITRWKLLWNWIRWFHIKVLWYDILWWSKKINHAKI